MGRRQPQDAGLLPRRRDQPVRGLRAARGARLGRLPAQVRRHPAPRPDPRGRGRHPEPLQAHQAGRRDDALLPALGDELAELLDRLGYDYDDELIPRNIEYYEPRTAHGSTLSRVVHAWINARSDREQSWELFLEALHSDVDDIQGGTTKEGIHLGAMAGTIDLLQRCYTGIEPRDDGLRLHPVLPVELGSLGFSIRYRGHLVHLEFTTETARVGVDLAEGAPINVDVNGTPASVRPGETIDVPLGPVADDPRRSDSR